METDQKLVAGFVHLRRGAAYYKGALRTAAGKPAVWTCEHTHYSPTPAKLCAEAELYRRGQAGREVFELARCGPCGAWWGSALAGGLCPHCGVLLERLKVLVLERIAA